jgi:RHS repeat-associated protein
MQVALKNSTNYPPFGSLKTSRNANTSDYRFSFNGQEGTDELSGVGNHTTATFWEYDTRLGRRWNLDPVDQISISNYAVFKNNPILFVDPDGDEPSTHTDEQGNIVAKYDDGVYVNKNETSQYDIDQQRIENKNTGGTGNHIGDMGGTINIDGIYSNLLSDNMETAKGIFNPFTFRGLVTGGGDWDLKSNKHTIYGLGNDKKTNFTFKGKIMDSQDIGNHHFGATGKATGIFPEGTMLRQAGKAQIAAGTSKPEWQKYKILNVPGSIKAGIPATTKKILLAPYGDDPRDQSWIKIGFKHK